MVVYLFYVLVRAVAPVHGERLAIGPRFFAGELWQPLTSLFVHLDFLGFLFSMIGLWFVGSFIERTQGTRRCAAVFFAAGVLANLAIAGVFRLRARRRPAYDDGACSASWRCSWRSAASTDAQPAQLWPTTDLRSRRATSS